MSWPEAITVAAICFMIVGVSWAVAWVFKE